MVIRDVASPPADSISNIRFSPTDPNILLASSWDCSVRLYNVDNNSIVSHYTHHGAVLDACFGSSGIIASGGLDNNFNLYNTYRNSTQTLGRHEQPISCVEYSESNGLYVTGSWDSSVKFWDPRTESCVLSVPTTAKVYAMAAMNNVLVVGMSDRKLALFDIRKQAIFHTKPSPVRYQLRCIGSSPSTGWYAVGSIEGRVALESVQGETVSSLFAFRCHRVKDRERTIVYPVNDICFHPSVGTSFATAGSDGTVAIWDGEKKKVCSKFAGFNNPISSISFNSTGNLLAIASSYVFEEGSRVSPPDAIHIRQVKPEMLRAG
ncbi:hypothetical protein RCL1_003638 [Eukaryota sp. TZLM3-RCL]